MRIEKKQNRTLCPTGGTACPIDGTACPTGGTPQAPQRDSVERRRAKARSNNGWRQRQRRGEMMCFVRVTPDMVKALVGWGWIQEDEIRDRKQIGAGIAGALEHAIEDEIAGWYLRAGK
jgi:hypothetical protein